ncbi:MAG TPA: NAD-dependent epimerase/dehydratase family protein [Candidatus Thioglobus sp.]|jgi:dTDP-4-dehydrorhamnose reductase|nr:NAD-dependent epimerase/dehydratase family protein [Candidatus Thioglobus sp.]
MKKVLILGGSSYVGRHLIAKINPNNVLFTYNKTTISGGVRFDSTVMDLEEVVDLNEVNSAVILLGDTNPETCIEDVEKSENLNVRSIKRIINALSTYNIKVIFASSEFVYDGGTGNYIESDKTKPILLYGKQKLEIEHYIRKNISTHTILRFAKIYGSELDDKTLFTSWLKLVELENNIVCADDQYFSPVHIDNVVDTILFAISNEMRGIFNLAGPVRKSRMELLLILIREINKIEDCNTNVLPCSIDDFNLNEKRPKDVSMNPSKLVSATGVKLVYPDEVCAEIANKFYQNM